MAVPTKVVKTKLFIGNLDPATQASELTELFSAYGPVLEASVIKDYGFVHFGSIEEAETAASALNNKEFHGKRLRVELSTSTVRHRPGQPEPASALRNSRARAAVIGGGNGVSRFSPAAPPGGVGPMRHSASAWIRGDARPYDGISMDPAAMSAGYGPPAAAYDRARAYDARSDPRQFYGDRRDSGYASGYEVPRDNPYGAPGYAAAAGGSSGGQEEMYPMRDYRDVPPNGRVDGMGYPANRMYDRNQGSAPADPYYGTPLAQGPPAGADPYQSYDAYQKYYPGRPREPEFPTSASQNPPARDYDPYASYRTDPYAAPANGQGALRHEPPVAYAHQQQVGYPPASSQRQQQPYGNAAAAPYAPALPQYYGAQQRA